MGATWSMADEPQTIIQSDNGIISSKLSGKIAQPLLWSQLVGSGIDPFSVRQSLGANYTRGNGISGFSVGAEAILDENQSVQEIKISGSIEADFVGGSLSITLQRDVSSPTGFSVTEANGFSGLNIIIGEHGQLLGLTIGRSAGVQAGYFFEWGNDSGSSSSVGVKLNASQGLIVGDLDANSEIQLDTTNIIRDISDFSAEQLTDLFLHAYDNGINPKLEPSILEKLIVPFAGLLSLLEPASERRQEALDLFFEKTGFDSCFGPEILIDMWPLDPDLKPGVDSIYDQEAVRAKVWKKPIELIEVGDLVVSFDDKDNLVPGPVTRIFQNDTKILLNFHGTRVTPGHVYYRPDSKKSYKYETLIDVLRDDGVIKQQDGTLIRAATNAPVDSSLDGFVKTVTGTRKTDGSVDPKDAGRIRLGTRFIVGVGKTRKSFAVADLIKAGGGVVGDDEMIRVGDGEPMPFLWEFGDTLPKPEDFVLACSGTTLEDIYRAAEWESQGPRLPAPIVLDRGPVQPLKETTLSAMPRNEPLELMHYPLNSQKL